MKNNNIWDKKNYIVEMYQVAIYTNKRLILDDLTLKIREGEFLYILGATATGKTSLLKLLMGILPLVEGQVRLFNFELSKIDRLSLPVLRRRLGILSWEYPLLKHRTIGENLELVLLATDWQDATQRQTRIEQVLRLLELDAYRFSKPNELSQEERAKVLFARSILNQPGLLMVDEITTGLDLEATKNLLHAIYSYAQASKTAVLYATNRSEIPEQCPAKILRIRNGKLNDVQNLPPPIKNTN